MHKFLNASAVWVTAMLSLNSRKKFVNGRNNKENFMSNFRTLRKKEINIWNIFF